MAEAQKCRVIEIFKLGGRTYVFDSTTINLCLSAFEWALFRKKKEGIKIHTLYDIGTQILTFFHITAARMHDTKVMEIIPYEENQFYIFDRAYNDLGRLFNINCVGANFVVRDKKNNVQAYEVEAQDACRTHVRCSRIYGRAIDQKQVSRRGKTNHLT